MNQGSDPRFIFPQKGSALKLNIKNLNPRVLLTHIIITLGYPAAKAFVTEGNKLQVFTDAMTIIAMVLLIGGVVYALILHGDYDIAGFVVKRGANSKEELNYQSYKKDQKEKRAEAFNYPLFLAIVYLIASAIIAYCIL